MPEINLALDPGHYQQASIDTLIGELEAIDIRLEADLMSESLVDYVRGAWAVIEPGRDLVWNWHLDYLCWYLEAFSKREKLSDVRILNRLIANIPVRCSKSLFFGVFYPTWVWTHDPSHQFLTLAHSDTLAARDAVKSRVIMDSAWYQARWGHVFQMRPDQNEKSRYENSQNGHRIALGMKSGATGENADTILIDDPHDAGRAQSESDRATVLSNFDIKFSSRLNDPIRGGIAIIMQRLHQLDLTGHAIKHQGEYHPDRAPANLDELEEPWEHFVLEMEYGGVPRYKSSIGLDEPRTELGELLWYARFPQNVVNRMKKRLGKYGASGQLQQRPTPEDGGILPKRLWRKWPSNKPFPSCSFILQSYDTAFTERDHKINTSTASSEISYSARSTWGVFYNEMRGRYCILLVEAWRDQCDYPTLRREAGEAYRDQEPDLVLIEAKASGTSLIQDLRRSGITVSSVIPGKGEDKVFRAYSVQSVLESGLVYYPDRVWAEEFVDDVAQFPNGASKDWTDTTSQAWERIRRQFLVSHPDDVTDEEDMENHDEMEEAKPREASYG